MKKKKERKKEKKETSNGGGMIRTPNLRIAKLAPYHWATENQLQLYILQNMYLYI